MGNAKSHLATAANAKVRILSIGLTFHLQRFFVGCAEKEEEDAGEEGG